LISPWEKTFFGLIYDDPEVVKTYLYDQLFSLAYHVHMSVEEAYRLPVRLRIWFFNKLREVKDREQTAIEEARNAK
jgi:hypothetical protein